MSYQENICQRSLLKKQEDYLVANLLDFFRKVEHEEKWLHAAKMAQGFIKRLLNKEQPRLDKRLNFLASRLKNNLSAESIRTFAHECMESAAKMLGTKDDVDRKIPKVPTMQKRALKDIKTSLKEGHQEQAALARAAFSLMKEHKALMLQNERQIKIKNHPLGETLGLLNGLNKPLPKEDIRNHLLHLKSNVTPKNPGQGILFSVLKKAQAFSSSHLHQLLGDELFFLCRPIGFADKNGHMVEVEVPTNNHLYALSYRKLELLKALKVDPTFKQAQSIKFKVSCRLF